MTLNASTVDIAILSILGILALLGFLKGLVKDFFGTVNIILAIFIAFIVSPFVVEIAADHFSYPTIFVAVITKFVVFVSLLIILSIFSSRFSKPLSERIPAPINQSLGFGFGFVKGYLVFAFILAILLSFYAPKNSKSFKGKLGPDWLNQAQSYDLMLFGANIFKPFIDDHMDYIQKVNFAGDDKKNEKSNKKSKDQDVEDLIKEELGYKRPDIEKMQRLIEIVQ